MTASTTGPNDTRFAFGANWRAFLATLNDERIQEAENSLREMLGVADLHGQRFLDIGSGSGLFSLAARRLGAEVHSFDFDPQSVACTQALRHRYQADDPHWRIEQGSVLDADYLLSLGQFQVVYAWGVLHHSGNMDRALRNAMRPVARGGLLFIAIYNDQDLASIFWKQVKKTYCSSEIGKYLISASFIPVFALLSVLAGLLKHRHPLGQFRHYKRRRGMSIYHDWIDWLGGYPFEVARPEAIFRLHREHGFSLENLVTTNRLGCNQFVFRRQATSTPP